MCGIAGILSADPHLARRALPRLVEAQAHRGPDDRGEVSVEVPGGVAALGHRRLAILDPTPTGRQPMVHPTTGDVLVFNGQLYDHRDLRAELEARGERFRGSSDTEVLLHGLVLLGVEALVPRLRGMFAFGFLQRRTGHLVLARDPLGIKPLHVVRRRGSLAFASEVRALAAAGLVDARPCPEGIASFLAYGAVAEPHGALAGVAPLPAGTWRAFRLEAGRPDALGPPRRHFSWPEVERRSESGAARRSVRAALEDAVTRHLDADVPVGVFLSGGLDSTVVAALAARAHPGVRTFTVGLPDRPAASEAEAAERTASQLGSRHETLEVSDADAESLCRTWLDHLDQPSVDGLNTFIVSRQVRDAGIKVALSGLGGDELFGGYPSFRDVPRALRVLRAGAVLPQWSRRLVARLAGRAVGAARREKLADLAVCPPRALELTAARRRALSDSQLSALGVDPALVTPGGAALPEASWDAMEVPTDTVAAVVRLEATLYMRNTLLRDSDTNGMAHGLEIRVPLLDRRVLDAALPLPGPVLLPAGAREKHLLREAVADLLPAHVHRARKHGFLLPLGAWMAGPLRPACEAALETVRSSGLLSPAGVDDVWRVFVREPRGRMWSRAFALCVLGWWLERIRDRATRRGRSPTAARP